LDVNGTGRFAGLTDFTNAINLTTSTLNYIYFNDALAFARNGVGERIRIDTSGNVGIGTSSPGSRLEVSGSAAQNLIVNSTSSSSYMQFANSGGITGYIGSAGAINSTGGNNALGLRSQNEMAFATGGNTERMRIDSSGKVGIGTNSPSSYDSSSLMAVVSASNTSLTVASGATGLGQILFANGTGIPNIYNGLIRYDHNGNSMSFFTNGGNERMRIDSSGYVTMPFQPSFRAGLSSGAPSSTSGAIWQFNNVSGSGRHNIGNHYNTSTYTFTAPVAGRYYFHMQVITESNTNNTARTDLIVFQINGSLSGYSERRAWYVLNSTGDSGYYTDNITAVFNLSAGDTVRGVNSSPTTATQHANVNYSIFEGYLIG
jgi:hypothetical protein